MKTEEKRNIIILIIIAVSIIIILINLRGKQESFSRDESTSDTEQTVAELESGTKLNVSEKVAERKYFADFEVSNIQLTEKDEKTNLSADVKNLSLQKSEITSLEINFYDKEGNLLTTIKDALIAEIEAGEKTKLNVSTNSKCIEAYDFSIKIAEEGGTVR